MLKESRTLSLPYVIRQPSQTWFDSLHFARCLSTNIYIIHSYECHNKETSITYIKRGGDFSPKQENTEQG